MTGGVSERPLLAPAGHPAVDQLRVALQTHVRSKPQTLHHTGAEALDQYIGILDQLQQHLSGARLARIDGDAATTTAEHAAVGVQEVGDLTVDPYDIRPHVCKHHHGERCRTDRVHFDNFHTSQWTRHFDLSRVIA
ncbi:hypothetical protein D3C76_1450960 [compost metagenome]